MKHSLLAVLLVLCATAASGEDSLQEKIDDALRPMPSILRDGAEVFSYDSSWNRTVLREGTNSIRCVAPGSSTLDPTVVVAQCFHESWESPFLRISQLQAEGMALEKVFNILLKEIDEGKVAGPDAGSVVYEILKVVVGDGVAAHPNMGVSTPGGTAASTGLSTEPDAYRPWLMLAGTPMAHIMIPGK